MSNVVDVPPAAARRPAGAVSLVAAATSVAVAAASYLIWLGWHEQKHLAPGTSSEVGPHEAWQVIGLTLTLVVIAAVGGWFRMVPTTVWATALAVSFMFSLEATTEHQQDASLWPVGAAMLFLASLGGLFVVAVVFRWLRSVIAP